MRADDRGLPHAPSQVGGGVPSALLSDCIIRNREPEPSGLEGLQDVRIVQALYESAETGKAVTLQPFGRRQRPTLRQRITRPGVAKPRLVHARSASEE